MTLSTPWLALVAATTLVLLGGGLRELARRVRSEDRSDDDDARATGLPQQRSREVSA